MTTPEGFHTYTRSGDATLEPPYEKPVVVPGAPSSSDRKSWASTAGVSSETSCLSRTTVRSAMGASS